MNLKYNKVFSIIDIDLSEFRKWENTLPYFINVKKEGVVLWTFSHLTNRNIASIIKTNNSSIIEGVFGMHQNEANFRPNPKIVT